MPHADSALVGDGRVAFELDRFELTDGARYVVEGRWFGVRGRRFIRPALTVLVDGQPTRLLADLADKPWAAEEGEPWNAAFPCDFDAPDLQGAELTVAPDITITLTDCAIETGGAKAKRPRRRTESSGAGSRRPQPQPTARIDELLDRLSRVTRERDELRGVREQLASDLDKTTANLKRTAGHLETAQRERDLALAERDAAYLTRDEAMRDAQGARVSRDRAFSERDAAIAAQQRAEAERDTATAARYHAVSERDRALASRDQAVGERDAAVAARDDAVNQRDAAAGTSERLQSELADVMSSRGAALVMRRATQEPPSFQRHRAVPSRAIAIVAMVVIVVVLLIILRVI
jgi:hypothetical protein